jgi:hypothetical protein
LLLSHAHISKTLKVKNIVYKYLICIYLGNNMSSFLSQYTRQPKIFIDLPSRGEFYPDGSLEEAYNIPVFGMTAMDEIILKTPDALFTGKATANVIKSCIPAITDPWQMPIYDLDFALIAIRIASYGDTMDVATKCPHCGHEHSSRVDLQKLLTMMEGKEPRHTFTVGDLNVTLGPINYTDYNAFNLQEYTLERQIYNLNNSDLDKIAKEKEITNLLEAVTKLDLDMCIRQIEEIASATEVEKNQQEIYNFISTSDSLFYKRLKEEVKKIKEVWELPRIAATCENEECGKDYQTKLTMDYSNFFVQPR